MMTYEQVLIRLHEAENLLEEVRVAIDPIFYDGSEDRVPRRWSYFGVRDHQYLEEELPEKLRQLLDPVERVLSRDC